MNQKDSFSFAQSTTSDNGRLFNIDVYCINCNEMINCEEIGFLFIINFIIYKDLLNRLTFESMQQSFEESHNDREFEYN